MIVAIFRTRVRSGVEEEYARRTEEMAVIARAMPGFISWKGYASEDGERVAIHEWESAEHLAAWRNHPEHVKMQTLGREKFYDEYTLYVCDEPRQSRFQRD